MTKVYLLLRNNKQSGPHSLEELLKLGLKPLDLIWVEGRSAGWSYPSEINALKPYVASTPETIQETSHEKKPQNEPAAQIDNSAYMPAEKQPVAINESLGKPKVYVSMPSNINKVQRPADSGEKDVETASNELANKIEQKAEELRKRAQSYVPEQKPVIKAEEPVVTKYSSTLPEREEAYTSWIYNQKVNKSSKFTEELQKKWGGIAIAALLILVVGYGVSQYHNDKKEVEVASTDIANANKTVPQPLIAEPEITAPATQPITNNIPDNTVAVVHKSESGSHITSEPIKKMAKTNTPLEKKTIPEKHKSAPAAESNNKKLVVNKNLPLKETIVKNVAETKVPEVKNAPKKEAETVAEVPKKKKTLNEKVDAFFGKFGRKIEEKPVAETSSASTSPAANTFPGSVERKATHREDKPVETSTTNASPTPPVVTNLAQYVQVSTNKPSENWMLGVHGLKVSLHNTSNEVVKTAEVELRYYTEQNEVLEKKIVNFSNIPPGKTVTLPAPDHRLADHADFRLVTAK